MREKANNLGINVIQEIPKNKDAYILDKEAINLLFQKAQEEGLILEAEERTKNNIDGISFFNDGSGRCAINTF